MSILVRWILPLAFLVLGVMILSGAILKELPPNTGLRTLLGVVVILLGVHRFVASRSVKVRHDRRFGGHRNRPWESRNE
ncbi:hypothetical protein IT157_10115 [bacterium]|jgi:uncharacterized membrane protein YfcA|nr:hypothetical protein [bacterium]